MAIILGINRYINLYRATLSQFFHWSIWWPLLVFGGLNILLLYTFTHYPDPVAHAVLQPYLTVMNNLVSALGIADNTVTAFSHYPQLYYLLPTQFEWGRFALGAVLEGLALALCARAFARLYNGGASKWPTIGFRLWIVLVGIWLCVYILLSAVTYAIPTIFHEWLMGSPRRMQLFDFGLFCLNLIVYATVAYAIPIVSLRRVRAWEAAKMSVRLFLRFPVMSFAILFIPSLIFSYPLNWSISGAAGIIGRLQPEVSAYLLGALVVADVVVSYFYVGAVIRLILDETPVGSQS